MQQATATYNRGESRAKFHGNGEVAANNLLPAVIYSSIVNVMIFLCFEMRFFM